MVKAYGFANAELRLFSDRVVRAQEAHPLDSRVSAAVELDGQVVVSHRPTLTRMAVGSILPGSALIPGLAFQKKQTTDNRVASFTLVHPDWAMTMRIPPDSVSRVRPLALQVNRIADDLRTAESAPDPGPTVPTGDDTLARLERIGKLLDQGVITTEQAARLRDEVLGSS